MFRACVADDGRPLDRASTGNCEIYDDESKPDDVYYDGGPCEFYEKADDKPLSLLAGLAVGDALGVPVEFKKRGSFAVSGMQGWGTHSQPPGTWSDDTSLALALVDGMLTDSICLEWVAQRFIDWLDKGVFTPHGKAFDVGGATARAIERLKKGVPPERSGGTGERDNGNGSLMRIAPLVFYFFGIRNQEERFRIARDVSSITHAHELSVAACHIYLEMLNYLRFGHSKEKAYDELRASFKDGVPFISRETLKRFDRILKGDVRTLPESSVESDGFVVHTLEAAFWSFMTTGGYREAVLRAVNLGDDADTTGAVTGAMAGLAYGLDSIPREWLKQLAGYEEIRRIAIEMPRWDYFRTVA